MSKKQKGFDLEAVYDAEIAPLMTKIIGICKKHKLPMFATFMYASDADEQHDFCTTELIFGKDRPIPPELASLAPTITGYRGPALRLRTTKSDGSVEDAVIYP